MSKSAHGSALPRTNAMRMLDAARIPYEVLTYEVDENDLSGVHIAEQLSYPPEMIFKTLVAHGDRTGYLVFCIPVALEIDLRTAASLTGNKKIEMVHVKDLLSLTGYIRGGCTAIGMKKQYVTRVDESAAALDTIIVSGGRIGSQIELAPADLLKAAQAEYAKITA